MLFIMQIFSPNLLYSDCRRHDDAADEEGHAERGVHAVLHRRDRPRHRLHPQARIHPQVSEQYHRKQVLLIGLVMPGDALGSVLNVLVL